MNTKLASGILLLGALLFGTAFRAQDQNSDDDQPKPANKSKFHTGFFVGSYFANKYSANTYNGYGFDLNGQQNTFDNSLMHQKIINEYGGGYGQVDQVAQALGVDPKQWTFTESDMPINMHYVPTIMLGFSFKVPVDKKSALLLNINGAKPSVEGNFTISTLRPQTSTNPAVNSNIKTCVIKGQEQRLQFELAFQRIFGDDESFNFMGELGLVGTLAKYTRNWIYINTLQIDLTNYYYQPQFQVPVPGRIPVGFGVGAFAGLGVNMNINPKFTLQLVYNLSQEKINLGVNPTLKTQHTVGLRTYYNF